VSDGSDDHTVDEAEQYQKSNVRVIEVRERVGKAAALNAGMEAARGDIVVFTDARQVLEPGCLRNSVANFADPTVGCVSGNLVIGSITKDVEVTGEQLKWKLENTIREYEGAVCSMVGALGAYYAARRCLLVPIPQATLLDDCYLPLNILRQGYRTVFERDARVWDDVNVTPIQEFRRKVRTLTGNYQLLSLCPWLLTRKNPILLQFISHKLLRLITPLALVALVVGSVLSRLNLLHWFAAVQLLAYALGGIAIASSTLRERFRPAEICAAVCVLIGAAVVAFINFVHGQYGVWMREAASTPSAGPRARVVRRPAVSTMETRR
jgi:cellulose synthase/poly-beta-1,6-N-acetylglucosamine synthase-like glycosyltransferase